jgi:serine protease AprX
MPTIFFMHMQMAPRVPLSEAMRQIVRAAVLLSFALGAFGGSKLAPDIPQSNPNALVDVIIQFKTPPNKDELKQIGSFGQIKKQFSLINGIHLSLPVSVIQWLAKVDPNLVYITPNRTTKGAVDVSTATVNANIAWSFGLAGNGVGVAVIDSGMTVKDDLLANGTSRVVYAQDFTGGNGSDAYGHGTHVAGIIGGNGADSSGAGFTRTFKGVAPNANFINLRVLDQNGSGLESNVIAAIERAIALKNTYNIRVINLSLGRQVYESFTLDPVCQAVEAAWKAGIVVVVAAGNNGRDNSLGTHGFGTIAAPGNDPYVITVGATNARGTATITDDTIATYSSKGPTLFDHIVKPDLVAPGNGVISLLASPNCTLNTYETSGTTNKFSLNYFVLSGTSMSTPVVSGAAALLIQQNPALNPDQVKARLMKTARKILPLYMSNVDILHNVTYMNQADIFTVGAGYLDINAALQNTDLATAPAVSPQVVFNPSTGSSKSAVTLYRSLNIIWGDNITWGENIVWGDNIVWADALIWGAAVFNGNLNGLNIIWGDNIVWGDTTLGGFNVIWGETLLSTSALQPFDVDDGDLN